MHGTVYNMAIWCKHKSYCNKEKAHEGYDKTKALCKDFGIYATETEETKRHGDTR